MQKVHWDYLLLLAGHNLGIGVRRRYGEPSRGMFGSIELEIELSKRIAKVQPKSTLLLKTITIA